MLELASNALHVTPLRVVRSASRSLHPSSARFSIPASRSLQSAQLDAEAQARPVEWLSDNGSPFTARETLDFAAALGLVPCFTPGKRKRLPRFRAS